MTPAGAAFGGRRRLQALRALACALAAAAGLLVSACGDEPAFVRPDLGSRSEKRIYGALDSANATDAQRSQVLKSYDGSAAAIKDLSKRQQDVVKQWHELDRTAPDFASRLQALSSQWADINGEEMRTRGSFEHDVAAVLDAKQWLAWQAYMKKTEPYDMSLARERDREIQRERY